MNQFKSHIEAIHKQGVVALILIPLVLAIGVYALPAILQLALNVVFPAPLEQIGSLPAALSMVLTLIIAIPLLCKVSALTPEDLGLPKKDAVRQSLIGALVGFGFLALVFVILLVSKTITVSLNPNASLPAILIGLLFFIAQGSWEELIYRSWLMPHLSKAWNIPAAIIISSLIFVAGHAFNPGMQPLPVVNLFIASVVFSLAYWKTGSLWFVGFAHGIWNFSQGFIFGAQVSGNGIPTSILSSVSNNTLIAGGPFGFEGGLVLSAVGIATIAAILIVSKKQHCPQA